MLWCGAGGVPHVTLCSVNYMQHNQGHLGILCIMWGRNCTVWESGVDTGKLFSLLGYLHMLTYTSFSTNMQSLKKVLMQWGFTWGLLVQYGPHAGANEECLG